MACFVTSDVALVLAVLLLSCGPEEATPVCTTYEPSCSVLYEPTYEQVFGRTLKPTCAKSGVSCHADTGKQGGLSFDDADRAYSLLQERGVVKAGDAKCSKIAVRLTATDPNIRMPPGKALEPAEICAIQHWIADGAKR